MGDLQRRTHLTILSSSLPSVLTILSGDSPLLSPPTSLLSLTLHAPLPALYPTLPVLLPARYPGRAPAAAVSVARVVRMDSNKLRIDLTFTGNTSVHKCATDTLPESA